MSTRKPENDARDGLRLNRTRKNNVLPVALLASAGLLVIAGWKVFAQRGQNAPPVAPPKVETVSLPVRAPRPTPTPQIYASRDIAEWAKGKKISDVAVAPVPGNKVFALTFDDGPWPEYTRQILAILKQNNVKASFFMVGQEVARRPEIAREVRDQGHAIGNHSWDHPSRPRDPIAQVEKTDAIIRRELGFRPTFFRPPYGIMKNGMAAHAMSLRDPVLLWSADSNDWKKPGVATIVRNVVNEAHPGGIALMHDGGGDRYQDVEALPIIISQLRAKGYRFVTIPELLKLRDANSAAREAARKTAKKAARRKKS